MQITFSGFECHQCGAPLRHWYSCDYCRTRYMQYFVDTTDTPYSRSAYTAGSYWHKYVIHAVMLRQIGVYDAIKRIDRSA